jgi:class 3 adenylate cyclase
LDVIARDERSSVWHDIICRRKDPARLSAILAADVVGYSRLMERDEAGTFERLKRLRKDLIEPVLERYGGRFVDLKSDGAIVEFGSVVSAVEAVVEIQRAMQAPDLPEGERIRYRIGINLGDVIIDGDTIYGDGVNVAARIDRLIIIKRVAILIAAGLNVRLSKSSQDKLLRLPSLEQDAVFPIRCPDLQATRRVDEHPLEEHHRT